MAVYNFSKDSAMREHFDIIIAGDQHSPRSFRISKRGIILAAATFLTITGILFSTAFFTTGLYSHNTLLTMQMASTKAEMRKYQAANTKLQRQLAQKDTQNHTKIAALEKRNSMRIATLNTEHRQQVKKFKATIANLQKSQARRLAQLKSEHRSKISDSREIIANLNATNDQQLATLKQNHNRQLDELKGKYSDQINDLKHKFTTTIARLETQNMQQRLSFEQEKEALLSTAVNELHSRSEIIEDVIRDIGIKIKPVPASSASNSGGPFVAADKSNYDKLIYNADNYLETLKLLPLGRPVKGSVSSWFGKREDPLNHKDAFHEGIDFRGRKGDPILATGEGKIIFAGRNGGYGNVIKIDHGNGYTSAFAHLDSFDVAKGDYVKRGQRIGRIGNSGRSTGSHLHYELNYRGRPTNPYKFMKVADKTYQYTMLSEKQECSVKKRILRRKSKKLKVKPSPQS